MSYKLAELCKPGLNAQGVPMGLVNYMLHNRCDITRLIGEARASNSRPIAIQQTIPPQRTRHAHTTWRSAIMWKGLSLTRANNFAARGFLDITYRDWQNHKAL